MVCFFFFFFKQKTAYEIGTGDWSSDVCSSDLPNNWVSFHENGTVGLYPMFAENRRLERREDVLEALETQGFKIENIVDYTSAEDEDV